MNDNDAMTPLMLQLLADAPGMLIDRDYVHHATMLALESRGYLRRVVSFNPAHWREGNRQLCWTRTELGEIVTARSRS